MSYVIDEVKAVPTVITTTSSTNVLANGAFSAIASTSDLAISIHNPLTAAFNALVGLSTPTATALTLSGTAGLIAQIPPGGTYTVGLRRNAGTLFVAGNGGEVNLVVTVSAITI
jgi:hypothetical protein